MKRLMIVLAAVVCFSSACVASKKYVRHEVKTSADGLSTRIDANGDEIRETQDAVQGVKQRVTDVDGKVGVVDSRVTAVDGRVAEVNGRVAEVDERVGAVDQQVRTVDSRVATVDSRVDNVNTKVVDLDTKTGRELKTLESNVGAVDGRVNQTAKNLITLDERFSVRNMFEIATSKSVKFRFDSATLEPAEIDAIKEIAGILGGNRDAIVVLEGHTDSTGDREYNMALGERRARAVRSYLAVNLDVPVYRIHEVSLGTAKPVAPNDTPDGRQLNRSVTLTVLVPAAANGGELAQAR